MHISLVVDRGPWVDTLRGSVRLGAAAGQWRDLVVRLVRTGTVDGRATHASRELFRRAPSSQPEDEIPFAVPVGDDPPSYSGQLFRIEYSVVARARLHGGEVLEAEAGVVLRPAGTAAADGNAPSGGDRLLGATGLILVVAGIVLIVASGAAFEASLGGAITAAIGAVLLAAPLRRRWWGRVDVHLDPPRPEPGSTIALRVAIHPRRAWILRRAEASLEAEEVVDVPDADGHTTRRERVVEARTTLFDGRAALRGRSMLPLEGAVVVPLDAPPTFRCDTGRLEWQVRVRLEGDGASWEDTFPAVVAAPRPVAPATTRTR